MDKQLVAEKSFTYLKNGVKILALLPFIPSDIKNIEIPLEIFYKRMQWAGWFKNDLSIAQQTDLRKAIKIAYEETEKVFPTNKLELLKRAKPEIEKLIVESPGKLASVDFEEQLTEILEYPTYLEGEYLTPNDIEKLTMTFLHILRVKIDNSSFADMLNRERIDDIVEYIKRLDKRLSKLEITMDELIVKMNISYIPHSITNKPSPIGIEFSYREDEVDELCKTIKINKKNILINGLGGIGKSAIARALYHRIKSEFKHIAWIEYQTDIKNSLLNSVTIPIFNDIHDENDRYRKIQDFLKEATNETILFIDNVSYANYRDSGIDWIETLDINVIMTSRMSNIAHFESFPIDFLREDQCVDIFYKYYGYGRTLQNVEVVHELVSLVNCHTLSVELLARVANSPKYNRLNEYLAKLKEKGFTYPKLSVVTDHNHNDSQTIAEQLSKLFELVTVSDEQSRILKNFSIMPSIEISSEVDEWLTCDINDIEMLKKSGWLTTSETGYYMHPIIKEAIRLQYKKAKYEDCESIIKYMATDEFIKLGDAYTQVIHRLLVSEEYFKELSDCEKVDYAIFCQAIGVEYYNKANYDSALKWYGKVLSIREKELGIEHKQTAAIYSNIAGVYNHQGYYDKALEYYEKAVKIYVKLENSEFDLSDIATTYNNLSFLYYNRGEYEKGFEYCSKVLEIREQIYGMENYFTAEVYFNICHYYYKWRNYKKAREYLDKALYIFENDESIGKKHPKTALVYDNVAVILRTQGDYEKALEWFEKALIIQVETLGMEHPDTVITSSNIIKIKNELSRI